MLSCKCFNLMDILGDCLWGAWQDQDCSSTCGGGIGLKTRTKLLEEQHGGICDGNDTMTSVCNTQLCERKCFFFRFLRTGFLVGFIVH